jgi:hypothetical protein
MSATLSIIRLGSKCMTTYTGNEKSLGEALTACALRDEVIAEAVTRAAVEVELHRQTTRELISMTKK